MPNVTHHARRELALEFGILKHMKSRKIMIFVGFVGGAVAALVAQSIAAKEARPPKWSRDVLDTFFDDARDELEGPRPDYENSVTDHRQANSDAVTDSES